MFCLKSSKVPAAAPYKMPLNGSKNANAMAGGYGPRFRDMMVYQNGSVVCNIGDCYVVGAAGATISVSRSCAASAMEVWQLADV